ncbi:MAG: Na+/H+ antiporter subunit E [Elusimicrobia bacterium]|nr:Na+/H+ antiporter subunit E [Elusimicrobiota bacterium]
MRAGKNGNFFYLFGTLFVLWLFLTSSLKPAEIFAGVTVSLILALLLKGWYSNLGFPVLTPGRICFSVIYIFVLFWEIIKANFDVAYRVLHPKMPIKPGIVVIKTGLKSAMAKMFLANSITLTPGTFTLDIIDDNLLVHWINVKTADTTEATEIIGGRFERYLKRIFRP